MKKLLVIIPDRLSQIIDKGELTPRYYNPGNLFEEVHILMTNDDHPDLKKLQMTAGRARLYAYNFPEPDLIKTGLFNPSLLNIWAKSAVSLAGQIKPDLIRCHGAWFNSYLAYRIKTQWGIPYVISLHINPDVNIRDKSTWRLRLYWEAIRKIERIGLKNANLVMPVYQPIIPYLKSMEITNYQVAYNALNGKFLKRKKTYKLYKPVRLISVGRLIKEKSPENIIRAIATMDNISFTIVGMGPEEEYLKILVKTLKIVQKVKFVKSLNNSRLCNSLPTYDLFVVYSQYFEISKSLLEALLTGLPCIVNKRDGDPVPELKGGHVLLVQGDPESYKSAINFLVTHNKERQTLGHKAYQTARKKWSPHRTEDTFVNIYKKIISEGRL